MDSCKSALTSIFILAGLCLGMIFYLSTAELPPNLFIDLSQYWAAAKLQAAGANPYDPGALLAIQMQEFPHLTQTIQIWNPPLLLPWIRWLGLLPFKTAASIWFIINISLILISTILLVKIATPAINKNLLLAILLTFYPIYDGLGLGQISGILLISLTLHLYFLKVGKSRSQFLSGAALAFTLFKPHLLILFYAYFLISALQKRNYLLISGFLITSFGLTLIPYLHDPNIYIYYNNLMQNPPLYWQTASLGSYLQGIFGTNSVLARSSPSLMGAAIVILIQIFRKNNTATDSRYWIIPLSLFLSPYGWVFDQILLLPVLIWIISKLNPILISARAIIAIIFCSHLVYIFTDWPQHYYGWYPVLIGMLGVDRRAFARLFVGKCKQ